MMFPNRDLYVNGKPRRNLLRLETVFCILTLLTLSAVAGDFITSDFSNVADSSYVLIYPSSIRIEPRDTLYVSLLKDEKLTTNTVDSSYYAEVVVSIGDTFCFFWGEYDGSNHNVYRRRVLLTEFGYTMLNLESVYLNAGEKTTFLHAARGTTPNVYVTTFCTNNIIKATLGSDSVTFAGKQYNSLCHVARDTFSVVYKIDNTNLGMRKVRQSGGTIELADSDILPNDRILLVNVDGAAGNISNSSVAADSSGYIFIMATRGGTGETKNLDYVLTNTDYDYKITARVVNGVSLAPPSNVLYADAPVVSYADKKFAAVYFKSTTVYLYDVTITPGTPPVVNGSIIPIVTGDTYRAPTIATNGKKLLVAWKNLSSNRLEGKLFTIDNGTLSGVPAQAKVYSDAATSIGDHGPELNAVIDEKDDIAIAWKQDQDAVGCIWAARGIMYPTGEWTSVVESVTVILGDSLVFLAGDVDTTLNGGTVTCSLQVGPTVNPPVGWTSWISLDDAITLAQNTKDTCKYFRYKANFGRNPTDTIKSPVFSEVTVRWNLKPRITSLDSVKVNNIIVSGISGFDDTVDVISHTDVMDYYFTVHDGDATDTVFVEVPWGIQPLLAKDTVTGSVDRIAQVRLMPDAVWDTVYTITFSGNDDLLWDAVSRNFLIRARKAAPVITQVTFNGDVMQDNGTVDIVIGMPSTLQVTIERPTVVD